MDFSQFGGMEGMGGMPNFAGMGKDMGDLDMGDDEDFDDDGRNFILMFELN